MQWLKCQPGVYQMSTGVSALALIPSKSEALSLVQDTDSKSANRRLSRHHHCVVVGPLS